MLFPTNPPAERWHVTDILENISRQLSQILACKWIYQKHKKRSLLEKELDAKSENFYLTRNILFLISAGEYNFKQY